MERVPYVHKPYETGMKNSKCFLWKCLYSLNAKIDFSNLYSISGDELITIEENWWTSYMELSQKTVSRSCFWNDKFMITRVILWHFVSMDLFYKNTCTCIQVHRAYMHSLQDLPVLSLTMNNTCTSHRHQRAPSTNHVPFLSMSHTYCTYMYMSTRTSTCTSSVGARNTW